MSSNDKPLKILVVEDEEHLRHWLCDRLAEFEEVEVVGETGSVTSAFRLVLDTHPNGLFLDIKLLGGDALQLLQQLKNNDVPIPPIIMITAFDEYAPEVINNWNAYVKRYLRKPFVENWEDKFRECINTLLTANHTALPMISSQPPGEEKRDYVFIREGNFLHRVNFKDMIWAEVAGGGAIYLVTERLQLKWDISLTSFLEQMPSYFKRISRDVAVNFDKVIRIDREDRGVITAFQQKEKFLGIGDTYYRRLMDELNMPWS